jgi:hypothetical protein
MDTTINVLNIIITMVIPLIFSIYMLYAYFHNRKQHFQNPDTKVRVNCPVGYKQCPSGDCIDEADIHQQCP